MHVQRDIYIYVVGLKEKEITWSEKSKKCISEITGPS